jgi:8-oxo-dGTP diphosphatase
MKILNPNISVDSVVFGFDYKQLKILLVERDTTPDNEIRGENLKLPGDLISQDELLDDAAHRVLSGLTGLENIYLKKFDVFDALDRMKNQVDLHWLENTTGLKIDRVITVAYYALIKLDEAVALPTSGNLRARWIDVNEVKGLAFDHFEIFQKSLQHLRNEIHRNPLGFELLPEKFSIRQLQNLYEIILGESLDNRNFRKKMLKQTYLVPLEEKEENVSHKPATLYRFDRVAYDNEIQNRNNFLL